jgi:[ribosomal protein S18]-alanine N-acetyltransferase
MRPLILSAAQPQHHERLERWLSRQERFYAKFSLTNLREWLSENNCFILEHGPDLIGCLLHVQVSHTVAAIIGLGIRDGWESDQVVTPLLSASVQAARARGVAQLSCVSAAEWLIATLQRNRFRISACLASYLKNDTHVPEWGSLTVRVRPATVSDLPTVAAIDAAAFEPTWHEEEAILRLNLHRSGYFIVSEWEGRVVGFAIGTSRAGHGHINRLAVHPLFHGRGVGTRLLAESINYLRHAQASYVTLNTQSDNWTSRRLYERFGFHFLNCDAQVLIRLI